MANPRYYVGIDLGTTFSTLAYVDPVGSVEALRLPDGECAMASAIYFKSPKEIVVGSEATKYAVLDPTRIAQEFKRNMGEGGAAFKVDGRSYRPEELSAMVVKKLLDVASVKLGPIESAVISVPQVFDEKRRRATQKAGLIAGLKEVDLVEEPVAAAIAYGHSLMTSGGFSSVADVYLDETVLVYDLGGGTFDTTVMSLKAEKKGQFTVLATAGEEKLGGKDWDMVLENYLHEQLHHLTGYNPQLVNDLSLLQDIRLRSIEAKKALSERGNTTVDIFFRDKEHAIKVTRGDFERLSAHLLKRSEHTLTEMLEKNHLAWGQIERILLVGGSSRMPMVAKMLERLSKRPIDRGLPPDIAVAKGAALFAARDSSAFNIQVKTVNSHALGLIVNHVKTKQLFNRVILAANQPTTTRVTRSFAVKPGQQHISLPILQGEHQDPSVCTRLGTLRVADLPDLPASAKVEVGFTFQDNGLLMVDVTIYPEDGQAPMQKEFDLMVDGEMSETAVQAAAEEFPGIEIE